jgi:hypothetical protein
MTARRRRSGFHTWERRAHLADRTLLDARAALRGPGPLARRLVRRSLTCEFFRTMRSFNKTYR